MRTSTSNITRMKKNYGGSLLRNLPLKWGPPCSFPCSSSPFRSFPSSPCRIRREDYLNLLHLPRPMPWGRRLLSETWIKDVTTPSSVQPVYGYLEGVVTSLIQV